MTYSSDQQFEQNSLDSLLSANIPSLKVERRLTVHDQHVIRVSEAVCLCIHDPFNQSANRLISTKPAMNMVPPEATSRLFFNFLQSVLTACRTEELVREKRHYNAA
jgi:hypothetical protein